MIVAVIGPSEASNRELQQAEAVGRELALKGCTVICGGRGGVMEAACRGAVEAGGLTIGVLPGHDREEMNRYVKVPIVTGLGEARNYVIVLSAGAVIAIGGGYGTLTEIGFALQAGRPVVGLGTWSLGTNGIEDRSILTVDGAVEAVEAAISAYERASMRNEWPSPAEER